MILFFLGCNQNTGTVDPPKEKFIQDYDQDGFFNDIDCDDLRPEVHPEAPAESFKETRPAAFVALRLGRKQGVRCSCTLARLEPLCGSPLRAPSRGRPR